MNVNQLLSEIKSTSENVKNLVIQIQSFIKDTSIPYEERHAVWMVVPSYPGLINPYIIHLDEYENKYGEISWYDDFYAERYSEVNFRTCVDKLEDEDSSKEQVRDFIEACMKKGLVGFRFDW